MRANCKSTCFYFSIILDLFITMVIYEYINASITILKRDLRLSNRNEI